MLCNRTRCGMCWPSASVCFIKHGLTTCFQFTVFFLSSSAFHVPDVVVVFQQWNKHYWWSCIITVGSEWSVFCFFSNRRHQQMFLNRVLNTQQPFAPTWNRAASVVLCRLWSVPRLTSLLLSITFLYVRESVLTSQCTLVASDKLYCMIKVSFKKTKQKKT